MFTIIILLFLTVFFVVVGLWCMSKGHDIVAFFLAMAALLNLFMMYDKLGIK